MKLTLTDPNAGSYLLVLYDESYFERLFYSHDNNNRYFTIAWNRGDRQIVIIDGEAFEFLPQTVLPLMFNQSFLFESTKDIVVWQFNREFYCIIDHDAEVSCVGFLFGLGNNMFINLDGDAQRKISLIFDMFVLEMNMADSFQNDMLVMLLRRLIIVITKLAKSGFVTSVERKNDRFDIIRKFNLLVEGHFQSEHLVSFYAGKLNKSPKTLANIFSLYNYSSPIKIIHERIIIEAKRLFLLKKLLFLIKELMYTKYSKERL